MSSLPTTPSDAERVDRYAAVAVDVLDLDVRRAHDRMVADDVAAKFMAVTDAEIERLRRWKAEASEVILGLQDVGKALGLGLGEQITGPSAVRAAERLTSRAEAAEAKVAELRRIIMQGGQDATSVRREAMAALAERTTEAGR